MSSKGILQGDRSYQHFANTAHRHGYPMLFFDRQWALQALYDQLQHKERVLLRSKVDRIEQLGGYISATTTNGEVHTGDILVGADGIHSIVRREMRRLAESTRPGTFLAREEDEVPCYYQCSFGIAQHVDGWIHGEQAVVMGHGQSFLVLSGPDNRVYWFLFNKLPEVKRGSSIPRYTKLDEEQFMKRFGALHIKENLTFDHVYQKRLNSTLTPLHEVVYKKWFFQRVVLMGDSVHKVSQQRLTR
jgi:2-polyprenyl-6-methoxyphenol hydroxylase-like FAD-dependent oxidoreductase